MPPEEASTVVVCGFVGCDIRPFNPLIEALPRSLHLNIGGMGAWVAPVLHQAALRDRHVGKAIGLMHSKPAEPWTVDELGRQVGLSRSALHERFFERVGSPPMQYLANWRMKRGACLLREGNATVATIAQEVGYESEAAFARAFKRAVGQPPSAWRRSQLAR